MKKLDFISHYSIDSIKVDMLGAALKDKYTAALPLSYTGLEPDENEHQNLFILVIPGRLEAETKDLLYLEHLLEELIASPMCEAIQIVLLGNAPEAFRLRIGRWKQRGRHVHLEEGYLSAAIYREFLEKADLLFMPLKEECRHSIYIEKLGHTKASGTIHDAIYFRKRALIPAFYPIADTNKNLLYHYNKDDLAATVEQIFRLKNTIVSKPEKYSTSVNQFSLEQRSSDLLQRLNQLRRNAQ